MKNANVPNPNQLDHPKEFLNLIAYSEMKRRGMSDKKIILYYSITRSQLEGFKTQHGLLGIKRGALHDHLQASVKKCVTS